MRKSPALALSAPILLAIVGALYLKGQTSTGVIVGSVTDPSGAVLSDVSITITNPATGLTHQVRTNSTGFYRSPDLPPGTYDIRMEHAGFKTAVIRGITVQINQTARVDIAADLGAVTQEVEVKATASLLQTETSSTGQVIQNQTIVNLPLNGRNYLDLTKLVPGVSQAQSGRGSEINQKVGREFAIVINGQRTENTDYLIDGAQARNFWVGTGNLLPSIDAIQEFKVQENSFSAEFGFGVALINAAIKSGSNGFHGSAFEFLRNSTLDAANFFANASGRPKEPLQRNQFGFTLGGPIKKDKVFFFGNYEGTRERRGSTLLGLVPSLSARAGDFSTQGNPVVLDPLTGQPFPGNRIPENRFSRFGRASLQVYPLPNASLTGANFVNRIKDSTHTDHFGLKGDWNISEKDTLSARFLYQNRDATQFNVMPLSGQIFPVTTRNAALSEIHTFSPNLINEFRLGYNYGNVLATQEVTPEPVSETLFGLQNTDTRPEMRGLPVVNVAGLASFGGANGGFRPEGGKNHIYQFVDNLTGIRGRQTVKGGFDIRYMRYRGVNAGVPRGNANFNGQFSRSGIADLLLGYSSDAGGGQGDAVFYQLTTSFSAYVQDDIRILPSLTLNMGLRWEYYQPPVDVHGENRQVFLDLFGSGRYLLVSDNQWRPGILEPDKNNLAPRIGLAWRVTPKTVVRAAYGIFYNGMLPQGNEMSFVHNDVPFRPRIQVFSDATRPTIDLARDVIPPPDPFSIACCPKQFPNTGRSSQTFDTSSITPYLQQWNLGIQREIVPNLAVEASYVGSHGVKLWGRGVPNMARGDVDLSNPTPIQDRRPFPWIGPITHIIPALSSWYESAQLKVEKRYSQGLLFLASYTFSKNLDMQTSTAGDGFTDQYNWALNKGLSPNDNRHRFVLSGVWEIPVGRSKRFGSNFGRVTDIILGGWGLNWIATFQTGFPIDVRSNVSNNRGGGASRPNRVCDPQLSKSDRTISRFIDTSCFIPQALGAIGNGGRYPVLGPGINNWDFSAFKTFPLLPEDRLNLQFRAEFFNGWNHTQFLGPDTWNIPAANFGVITEAARPREMQFGLRLTF
jgi:hypothetical protein